MNARNFLKQPKKLDKIIENKLAEKEQWKAIASGITAQMNGERVQSSGSQQKMADAIGRYIDIEEEINAIIDKLIDTKKDVINVIEQLNVYEYDILHKVYVQDFTLQQVAYMYDKSIGWAKNIHKKGLRNVQRILDEREGATQSDLL